MNRVLLCNILISPVGHPDYRIEVKTVDGAFEAWLHHKDYGVSTLMFGSDMDDMSLEKFLDIVYHEYVVYLTSYKEAYEDEEPMRDKYGRFLEDENNLPF